MAVSSFLEQSKERYASKQNDFKKRLEEAIGRDQVIDVPLINPLAIIKALEGSPRLAASQCQQACNILSRGHHNRIHEYLIVAYQIGLKLKENGDNLDWLATDIFDARMSHPVAIKKIRSKPLNYLFIFIFALSGLSSRNRANHYAESFQPFYDEGRAAAEVDRLLKRHGQERLRKAATRLKSLQDAGSWAATGSPLREPSMIEALRKMDAEEPEGVVTPEELSDWGPRALPTDQGPFYDDADDDAENLKSTDLSDDEEKDLRSDAGHDTTDSNKEIDDKFSNLDFERAEEALENSERLLQRLRRNIKRSHCKSEEKQKMGRLVDSLAKEIGALESAFFQEG